MLHFFPRQMAAFIAGILLALTPALAAEDNQASIAAAEALLSLPQTQPPEGGWTHEPPPGFNADESDQETSLIEWLKEQKNQGADLNIVRHGGTLLHHAIRAGLVDTAFWLMKNGADPLKEAEHDSLELALVHRQDAIFKRLIKYPGMLDGRRQGIYQVWNVALSNRAEGWIDQLIEAHVPVPLGKNRQALLNDALRTGDMRLIHALTAPDPDRILRSGSEPDDADIETMDRRLPKPVFPFLIRHAASAAEVDRLFRLRIRRPWDDPGFATETVRAIVWRDHTGAAAPHAVPIMLERLPDSALLLALRDESVFSLWWRWLSTLPRRERALAMAHWGDLPQREPEAILKAATKGAYWFDQNEKNPNAAEAWGELLASLRPPLPASVQGKLWMFVPQAHRLTLLGLGYRPSSEELRWWLERNNQKTIDAFWPQMLSIRPEIGKRLLELAFEPVEPGSDYYCPIRWETTKVLALAGQTRPPAKPYAMEAGCWFGAEEEFRQTLLSRGWVRPPAAVAAGRIEANREQCSSLRFPKQWKKLLIDLEKSRSPLIDGETTQPDSLMAITIPGEEDCIVLAWGGNAGGRIFYDDDSFEGMRRLTPCTDDVGASALFRWQNGRIEKYAQDYSSYLGDIIPIRDNQDGKHYWVGRNNNQGGCGQTPPELLTIDTNDGQPPQLRALPMTHPAMQALLTQCRETSDFGTCLGLTTEEAGTGDQRRYPEPLYGIASFSDLHWNAERKKFVDAVLDFRLDILKAMKEEGIFPHWITDAMAAVSSSSLPLAEKRRRTAWLFRDRALLGAALQSEVLGNLVEWLPPEDWRPIIETSPDQLLHSLMQSAETQQKPRLACRFASALKMPCKRKSQ